MTIEYNHPCRPGLPGMIKKRNQDTTGGPLLDKEKERDVRTGRL